MQISLTRLDSDQQGDPDDDKDVSPAAARLWAAGDGRKATLSLPLRRSATSACSTPSDGWHDTTPLD